MDRNKGLEAFKNVIWALCIYGAMAAIIVGLVISLTCKFYGDAPDGTLYLGDKTLSTVSSAGKSGQNQAAPAGQLNEMTNTQDQGLERVLAMTFLCDHSLSGIAEYSMGNSSAAVWTDSGAGLPVVGSAGAGIIFPGDGSTINPVNAAMISRPASLVIYLGGDDVNAAVEDTFVQNYEKLINQIRAVSPDTVIICCTVASVTDGAAGDSGLTAAIYSNINSWIAKVCTDTGAYYADLASILNNGSGHLSEEYASPDGRTLNSAGISKVLDYFRYHGIKK